MATEIEPRIETARSTERGWMPCRLPVSQLLQRIDSGIFPHDARVELLGGVLIQMTTKGDPHDFASGAIAEALRASTPEGWMVREDKSLQLGHYSRPEPMSRSSAVRVASIATGPLSPRNSPRRRGRAIDLPLRSRREMASLRRGRHPDYRRIQIHGEGQAIPIRLAGQQISQIASSDILPKA